VHKAVLDCIRVHDTAGARAVVNRLLDVAEEESRHAGELPGAS
jgi:Zn-finger protein